MCCAPWSHPTRGTLRCGQCMECRLAYSREWAIRISHEARMHERSAFLTLTYSPDTLPAYGQLLKRDLQLFFKRLRKRCGRFRYVACGEYGERFRRPHFHVALFGIDFAGDRVVYSNGVDGDQLYVSRVLSDVWGKSEFPFGHTIGSLTFESAAYIARYITKRITGVGCSPLPLYSDPETGEIVLPNSEFLVMSKGIGKAWFREYFMKDVYPHARVITEQGSPAPVPRYYKELLKDLGADLALDMSGRALAHFYEDLSRRTFEDMPDRRSARSRYAASRSSLFTRDVEVQ